MESQPFGLTLLVDKPLHWTSFDVVNKLRYTVKQLTGKKKNKVGHAGTLDPLATGLLIICVGSHTKSIESLMGMNKTYTGTISLGVTTPSYDLETEKDETFDVPPFNQDILEATTESFLGETTQYPPIFSAKKINGKKAYELARKGKEVEMRPNLITISDFAIDASRYPAIDFELTCSKGTYIRSIAHDFGKKLKSGAHLSALKRTKIGESSLEDAHSISSAIEHIEEAYANYLKDN